MTYVFIAVCDPPVINDTSNVTVIGYNIPALEDTSIMFRCPPGLKLTGFERVTCMENREWEPDPRNVTCIDESKHTNQSLCKCIVKHF